MRCEDVTRELASPTGAVPQADLAGHLAACRACAEWSRRAAQLDRTWEATRPPDPSPERLDALWFAASAALDRAASAPAPRTLALPARPLNRNRRRWALGAAIVGLAQAAAILAAAWLPARPADNPPSNQVAPPDPAPLTTQSRPSPAPSFVVAENYQTLVVHIDPDGFQVEKIDTMPKDDLIPESNSFLAMSEGESLANMPSMASIP